MKTETPPLDTHNEAYDAQLALRRCRAVIEKAALPLDWELWVARSLLAKYEAQTQPDGDGDAA